LVSDGINQPKQNIEPIKTQISSSRAEVYLIGWTGDKNFISSDKVFQLSEKSELVSNINNLKLQ
jgi:argonaute-like protein implicated in RNA metabolism and viral defense